MKALLLLLTITFAAPINASESNLWHLIGGAGIGYMLAQPRQPQQGYYAYPQQYGYVPGQQYILIQPQIRQYQEFYPPAYMNGAPFCPPGKAMYQRIAPYGNIENVGCR